MAEESSDAVFDVGIIHHIANWRAPVGEVSRVLRPGGRFLSEEATAPGAGSDGATARSATILATTGLVLSASSASSNASNSTSAIGRSPASSMPSSSVSPPNANHERPSARPNAGGRGVGAGPLVATGRRSHLESSPAFQWGASGGASRAAAKTHSAKLPGQEATANARAELVRRQLEDARPHRWPGCAPANPSGWFNVAGLANRPVPWLASR
jgi:hypothetical protein